MISIDLSGKTILITGALGAIAEHMVRRLAASGATLVLTDIKPEEQARRTLNDWQIPPSSYLYFSADITDSSQVDRVVNAAFEKFPGMDTVIGHAGGCGLHPFATTSEADYERIFRFNYFASNLSGAIRTRAMGAAQNCRSLDLHILLCSSNAAHANPFLLFGQSGAGKFRPQPGPRICPNRHSRECGFAGERRRRQFAESFRRGSRLPGICAASFAGQKKQPGVHRGRICVSVLAAGQRDQRTNPQPRLRRRHRESPMKIGLGLYRHMLTREYYDFARQAGCTHVVVHLVDYFNQGPSNPRNNQPTGSKYEPWGVAGDPDQLWTTKELKTLRGEIEDAGLVLAAIENLDPAHWHDILLDGPQRPQQIEKVKTIIRRLGEAGIPVLGYNFSLAGVCGRVTAPLGRGRAITLGMDGPAEDVPIPNGMVWNMVYDRNAPAGTLPSISHEELWRRLQRFLEEVIPVAEQSGVRLAAHPDDPPMPTMRQQPRLVYQPHMYQTSD